VLPGQVRKLGKVVGYDQVGRSLIGKGSGKVIRPGKRLGNRSGKILGNRSSKILGNTLGYGSGSD
jgi:hypothetical protein